MPAARLLFIESHSLLAEQLRTTLGQEPGLSLVGGVDSVQAALELLFDKRADAVVIDLSLADMSGLQAIPLILALAPLAKVILLVDDDNHRYVEAAIRQGACACVCKQLIATDLIPTVHQILAG